VVQRVNNYAHRAEDVSTNELRCDHKSGHYQGLSSCGWNHVCTIKKLDRVPHGEAVRKGKAVVVEGVYVLNDICEGKPSAVLLGVEEPGTCLDVEVHDQVKDHLEELERELNTLDCINEGNNSREPDDSK